MERTTTTALCTWVDELYHQCESLALHLIGTSILNALRLHVCISRGLKVSRLFCFCGRFHVCVSGGGAPGVSLTPLGRHPCRMCCWPTPNPFETSAIMQHSELLVNANYILESNRGGWRETRQQSEMQLEMWLCSRELCECALTNLFPIWLTSFFFFFFFFKCAIHLAKHFFLKNCSVWHLIEQQSQTTSI